MSTSPTPVIPPLQKHATSAVAPVGASLRLLSDDEQRLLARRLSDPCECIYDPCFEDPSAEPTLMGPMPGSPVALRRSSKRKSRSSDDSGLDLLAGMGRLSLTPEQERHLFLRLNYARFRVMRLLQKYAGQALSVEAVRELLKWEGVADQTRNELVRANVPLVLAMARRTRINSVDFSDLISEGNLALLRSVDKFDSSRGYKFSTYACRAILKSFSRVATRTARYRGHFPTEFDPTLEKSDSVNQKRSELEDRCISELRWILGQNLAQLSDVERQVIRARFAIEEDEEVEISDEAKAKTLEQVGEMIGVTKERVRQIQNKALTKLRGILEEGVLAV